MFSQSEKIVTDFFKPVLQLSNENKNNSALQVNAEHPYVNFDLGLSEEEKKSLERFSIDPKTTIQTIYNNFGELEKIDADVIAFLNSLGDNSAVSVVVSKLIARLVNNVIKFFDQETAWVSIRAFLPMPIFKIPRWHQDGYYYSPFKGDQCKVAITLKGPRTLFFNASDEQKKIMTKLESEPPKIVGGKIDMQALMQHTNYVREELNKVFDPAMAVCAELGQGSIFITGSQNAAVHSEPDITTPRLFMSILPGSKNQIQEVLQRQENSLMKK